MQPGDLVGERFQIEHLADTGGMSAVYRARDRTTGELCAIKTLFGQSEEDAARFAREAELLAELSHPGVVRYVTHGTTEVGVRWIALEWLVGLDLGARLARFGELTVEEALLLTRQVGEALAATHERGIIHRDIKPRNLFLVDGSIEQVKLLDFGVARVDTSPRPRRPASTDAPVVGTPGYMAPEQARGEEQVRPSADVFSLGCVLFECLTGEPAFSGEQVMSLLAKILLEEAPRVRSLRPGVPPALDDLTARMLSKNPDDRPRDGSAVLLELARLELPASRRSERPVEEAARAHLTRREQRLLCVVAARRLDAPRDQAGGAKPTAEASRWPDDALRAATRPFGARVERLADGSLVATLEGRGSATDLVAQAARCALALRPILSDAALAVATGRGELDGRVPAGEAIERAVRLLDESVPGGPVRVDEVTAGLLDSRFDIVPEIAPEGGLSLVQELDIEPGVRTLLGKPTPYVGRDAELSTLQALYQECAQSSRALAVLVTGPPGGGKSRLVHEFLRRARKPSARGPRPQVWTGRGDPMRAGSPLGLIAQALRGAAGMSDAEPAAVRASKMRERVARHVPAEDVARVAEFLGEMCGAQSPEGPSLQLYAARQDPRLMADQTRRAWEDFLAAECAEGPVILVLEDLHWGDLPTVRLVDGALGWLDEKPFLVVAAARPEIAQLFPHLWAERSLTQLSLGDLSRKAAEKLVRHVLGKGVTPELTSRLTQRAAGNAFYLEELIRAVANAPEGSAAAAAAEALPETVLAMVQARLSSLDAEARRVLRAASVFGQAFWVGGVVALLGDTRAEGAVLDMLSSLVEGELLMRRPKAKFPGEEELSFRHALVRDAAYSALTDADRAVGHRLAGEWLERAGESDPMVLAEHFERAGEPQRAMAFYLHAAELALDSSDFASAIDRAERGVAAGAKGEVRAALQLVAAQAHLWAGDLEREEACAREAMELAQEGTALWCDAAGVAAMASGRLGSTDRLVEVAERLLSALENHPIEGPQVVAATRVAMRLFLAAQTELAERLMARVDPVAAELAHRDPTVAARLHRVSAWRASFAGDTAESMKRTEAAALALERIGNLRELCSTRANLGDACADMGRWALAEVTLRGALASATRLGLPSTAALAHHNLGRVLAQRGKLEEARSVEVAAVEAYAALRNRRMEGGSRIYLARIEQMAGDAASAERQARLAVEVLAAAPPIRCYALGTLASVLLTAGRAEEAASTAAEAMQLMEELGGIDAGESLVRVVHAEALAAIGDRAGAKRSVAAARERLLSRAARIRDEDSRQSFLTNVPENARTMELAATWK